MIKRQELVRRELIQMRRKSHRVKVIVALVMKEMWGVERLWITPATQKRLYLWWVWSERHKVPIRYIIEKIVGWARQRTSKRKKKNSSGLGMRITTLTSKRMEALLIDMIEQDFPNGEHIHEWTQSKQTRLLALDEPIGMTRPLLNLFETDSENYLENYKRRVNRRFKRLNRAVAAEGRKRRRWRGSPWR